MISVVILTKNEEKNIIDCIESVLWADEIVIIDDFSSDRSIEVIKSLNVDKKIKIFQKNLENNFSKQRNFALSKVKYDWVLFLDADETVPTKLKEEINDILITNPKQYHGFYIKRCDFMWGKKISHGEVGNIKLLRLARKNLGDWTGSVHERWEVEGNVSELENCLYHFPHKTVAEFLKDINFYTSIRARELYNKKIKVSLIDIIIYPSFKFFLNYFIRLGFLDGIEGLVIAILMSFHSFLVRGKLWILWKQS